MDFVAVDLGASDTRLVTNKGKIEVIPNNMVIIQEDTNVALEPYGTGIEEALDVTIECDNDAGVFPVRVLVGAMASRFSGANERPSLMMNKHVQRINYISAILSTAIAQIRYGFEDDLILYLAIPPVEIEQARKVLGKGLTGNYTVTFNKLGRKVEFTVGEVKCYEESFLALLSYFFDRTGRLREESKKYWDGNILSMDIGASTTDLAIASNREYLEKSGQTYKTGGNVARDFLIDDIRAEYGYDMPVDVADKAMAEGRIQLGNSYKDIPELVQSAKQNFARQIVEQMQGYFRKVNMPLQIMKAIVVSGGGSMRSEYEHEGNRVITSEPMSYYITEELNKICSGVAVENKDEPRTANIDGLFIRANIDIRRREMAARNRGIAEGNVTPIIVKGRQQDKSASGESGDTAGEGGRSEDNPALTAKDI